MIKHSPIPYHGLFASIVLIALLLAGCSQPSVSCLPQPQAELSGLIAAVDDDRLRFRFPLDEHGQNVLPNPAIFCTSGGSGSAREYHAAEDYHLPAGTPVYAIADGEISFSGPRGGYGWLIIIDHPRANIYSLYGHLSPSRWKSDIGSVERGDLIGYLGDPDENGGSADRPLRPHLHFGIRVGQRTDYPGMGEWRWQAGWIKPCPQDLGWLRPSEVLIGQEITPGGFPEPAAGLLDKWGVELGFIGIYLLGGAVVIVVAIRKSRPVILMVSGGLLVIAAIVLSGKGTLITYALIVLALLEFGLAFVLYLRRSREFARAAPDN